MSINYRSVTPLDKKLRLQNKKKLQTRGGVLADWY